MHIITHQTCFITDKTYQVTYHIKIKIKPAISLLDLVRPANMHFSYQYDLSFPRSLSAKCVQMKQTEYNIKPQVVTDYL
jgi:hypothetical protein